MSGRKLAERPRPLRLQMKLLFISGYTDNSIGKGGRTHVLSERAKDS